MSNDEAPAESADVYRQISDGTIPRVWSVRNWPLLLLLVLVVLGLGVLASLRANADSLPEYRGEVIVIGLVWGAVLVVLEALFVVLAVLILRRGFRRRAGLQYAAGSLTEVELREDVLVIRRPTGESTLPYRGMARVRTTDHWISIFMRDRLRPELLPAGLLPATAIGVLRGRAGRPPTMVTVPDQEPTLSMLVPPGWAAHQTTVARTVMLRGARFWASSALFVLVGAVLGVLLTPAWWLLGPVLILVRFGVANLSTRRAMARALPAGTTATTYVLEDRLISHNAGGTREILFADVRRATVYDDVVGVRLGSVRRLFLIAGALIPPDTLARLTGLSTSPP